MNRFLAARGIIQNVTGRLPAPTITAPEREARILTMISEEERLSQFELSANIHKRKTWPIKGRFRVTNVAASAKIPSYPDDDNDREPELPDGWRAPTTPVEKF